MAARHPAVCHYVWPDLRLTIQDIAHRLDYQQKAAEEMADLQMDGKPYADALRKVKLLEAKVRELQNDARKKFMNANGWLLGRPFSLAMLGDSRTRFRREDRPAMSSSLDHPEYFWCRSHKCPSALLVHNYRGDLPSLGANASRPGEPEWFSVGRMESSWYYPGSTTAFLIRAADQAPRCCSRMPIASETGIRRLTEHLNTNSEKYALPNARGGSPVMFTYVKLHQEGKQVAISTNAAEEHEFIRGVSDAILKLNGALTAGELEVFLPQVVDICCKMRGYKNTVDERRVLIAGRITPTEESVIAASVPAEPLPQATPAAAS